MEHGIIIINNINDHGFVAGMVDFTQLYSGNFSGIADLCAVNLFSTLTCTVTSPQTTTLTQLS